MKISQDQMNTILDNAPKGMDKQKIVEGYIKRGYEIEGIDTAEATQYIASKQPEPEVEVPVENLKPEGEKGLKGFATGVGKGVLSTFKGMSQVGENIGQGILGGVEKVTGLPVSSDKVYTEEALQASADKGGAGKLLLDENLKAEGTAEKIGKFGEQVAEFAIPAGKVETLLGKGANLTRKILSRAATSGTVATMQEGEVGKGTATAVATEALFPVVGKFVSGLFRGVGSTVSGMSDDAIKEMVKYSETGKDAIKTIKQSGQEQLLKDNVKTYITSLGKFKTKMGAKFEKALDKLEAIDIKPEVIKEQGLLALQNSGVKVKNGVLDLSETEIINPLLQKRATNLINTVNQMPILNGKTVREAIKRLESGKFKTPGIDPDRQAYNQLMDDLIGGFRDAIDMTTDKLKKANVEYSQSKGLAEAVQDILGNVKYKGQEEILAISKKLENLLSLKGLSEDVLTNFFKSVGVDFGDIKAKETIRQISTQALEKNSIGTNPFEILRALSSKILTPKMIRDAAILTGQSESYIKKIFKDVEPAARGAIIENLMNVKE